MKLLHYPCIESVEKILSEERSSRTKAAELLLDKILVLEADGWFQAFLDTLQASGQSTRVAWNSL